MDDDAPELEPPEAPQQRVFDRGDEVELGLDLAGQLGDPQDLAFAESRVWRYSAGSWDALEPDLIAKRAMRYAGRYRWAKNKAGDLVPVPIALRKSAVVGVAKLAEIELARPGFFTDAPAGAAFQATFARVDGDRLRHERLDRWHRVKREHVADYAPDSARRPEHVDRLLAETWDGCDDRDERIAYLWEWLGAALCGITTRWKDSPILIGRKDSGKSRVLDAIAAVFPANSRCSVPIQEMHREYYSALMSTKRLNVVNELPEKEVLVSETAKAIYSGDPVTVRHPYGRPFQWLPRIANICAANALPPTPDPALMGRLVVLDCPNTVPVERQDRTLKAKIEAEAPQIAGAALVALRSLLERGHFVRPIGSRAIADEWARNSNPVAAWAADHLDNNFEETSSSALYDAYGQWAERNGHRKIATNTFAERLKSLGYTKSRRAGGSYWHAELLTPATIIARQTWRDRAGASHD